MTLTAWPARGLSWSRQARRIIWTRWRQALLPQPFCARDILYLDALLHQVLDLAILPKDLYQRKYTDSSIAFGLHCDGLGYRNGMLQAGPAPVRFAKRRMTGSLQPSFNAAPSKVL